MYLRAENNEADSEWNDVELFERSYKGKILFGDRCGRGIVLHF